MAVNIDGYYDFTLKQLERARQEGLLSKDPADILKSVPDVDAALNWCEAHAGSVHGKRAVARARWSARDGWVFVAGVGAGLMLGWARTRGK